ncbi:DUF134 domain-containing protein [Caldisericum sp.]|uniref:DUF134 domain-containing protein n=1 Tax=Caldisericum sp. TaxID=2499687 RepID=UPI003D14C4EA
MARPLRCRRVWLLPNFTYFKPAGIKMAKLEEVVLTVDEFEAVRLKDLEELEQEAVGKKMNISQPTLHRLLLSARKKIAEAIVKGKAIKIEGGVYMVAGRGRLGSGLGRGLGRGLGSRGAGGASVCVCPKCGNEQPHARGIPCTQVKCSKCGTAMIGKQ